MNNGIGYTAKQVARNKHRTASLLVGIVVALSLVAGINIASDNMRVYYITKALEGVPIDAQLTLNMNYAEIENWNAWDTEMTKKLEKFGVTSVFSRYSSSIQSKCNITSNPAGVDWGYLDASYYNTSLFLSKGLDIMGTNLTKFFQESRFKDLIMWNQTSISTDLTGREVFVTESLALDANLSIGDTFSIGVVYQRQTEDGLSFLNTTREYQNLVVKNFYRVSYEELGDSYNYNDYTQTPQAQWSRIFGTSGMYGLLASLDFARELSEHLIDEGPRQVSTCVTLPSGGKKCSTVILSSESTAVNILLDHARLDISDPNRLIQELENMRFTVYTSVGGARAVEMYQNFLGDAIHGKNMEILAFRTISLIVILPVFLAATFLVNTLTTAHLEGRRVEIGNLKSRGAKRRFLLTAFVGEMVTVGLIGSGIGIGTGYLLSFYLLSNYLGPQFSSFIGRYTLVLSGTSILLTLGIGVIIAVLGAIRPIRRYARLPVSELQEKFHEGEATHFSKSKKDWVILVGAVLPLITLFVDINDYGAINSPDLYFVRILIQILYPILIPLAMFSPLLLTYAIVKFLIGRSKPRFEKMTSGISRVFLGNKGFLASRNINRDPKRISRLVFLIGLTLSFGLASAIMYASETNFQEDMINAQYGSDLRVNPWQTSSYYATPNASLTTELGNLLPRGGSVVPVTVLYSNFLDPSGLNSFFYSENDFYANSFMTVVNVSAYLDTVYLKDAYFEGNPTKILRRLTEIPNSTLVPISWASQKGYSTGDRIDLDLSKNEEIISRTFEIVGYFRLLPGGMPSWWSSYPTFLVDYSSLNETAMVGMSLNTIRYLIDLRGAANANQTQIEETIKNQFSASLSVSSRREALQALQTGGADNLAFSTLRLVETEFYFLLALATAGTGILFIIGIAQKRREYALYRARGMTSQALTRMLFFEGMIVVLLGLAIGLLGFLCGYFYNVIMDTSGPAGFSRTYNVPWITVGLQIGLAVLSFILVVFLAARRERRYSDVGQIPDILRTS